VITFSGGSDDIVAVTTPDQAEEYYTYEKGPIMWRADVIGPEPGQVVRVTALLLETWHLAAGQLSEDNPLPDWAMRIIQDPDTSYSALLEIDAPEGSTIANIWPKAADQ
jgi:hypothetical protein